MIQTFRNLVTPEFCNNLAKKTQFVQRASSKLKGYEFVEVFVFPSENICEDSLNGLCDRITQINPEADISASALCQRINTFSATQLILGCWQHLLNSMRKRIFASENNSILSIFNRVLIQDSTVINLYETTIDKTRKNPRSIFSGKAKIDVIHNYTSGLIMEASIIDGNIPDQTHAERILRLIQKTDLVLRDQGYFTLNSLKQIDEAGAYYISRLLPNVKIFLNFEDEQPIDLAKYIYKKYRSNTVIDINVYIGDSKVSTRLIMYRLSKMETDKRLRKANRRAQKTGRQLSKAKSFQQRFIVFVTNVDASLITAEELGTIYRLRWQIELLFKEWKSILKIDVVRGEKQERIHCLLYGRLCMVFTIALISGWAKHQAHILFKRELSAVKLTQFMLRNNRLKRAILEDKVEELLLEVLKEIPRRLCKDKRKRKTTLDKVLTREKFSERNYRKNRRLRRCAA